MQPPDSKPKVVQAMYATKLKNINLDVAERDLPIIYHWLNHEKNKIIY
tara:strand:+ start:5150 stop:5293 length:144 start_codon:yes stop_codon:yes gene_type:complete